jgi:hypothetical protein
VGFPLAIAASFTLTAIPARRLDTDARAGHPATLHLIRTSSIRHSCRTAGMLSPPPRSRAPCRRAISVTMSWQAASAWCRVRRAKMAASEQLPVNLGRLAAGRYAGITARLFARRRRRRRGRPGDGARRERPAEVILRSFRPALAVPVHPSGGALRQRPLRQNNPCEQVCSHASEYGSSYRPSGRHRNAGARRRGSESTRSGTG